MRFNYLLNEDKTIKMLTSEPLDESKPIIEIEDNSSIQLGLDKIVNGKLVKFLDEDPALEALNKNLRILELKRLLAESDYKAIKFAEGELTAEEYAPTREERRAYREEINELQK